MNFNMANAEDQQLDTNMQLINYDLCSMLDNEELSAVQYSDFKESNVLKELNHKINDLTLGSISPQFEFHGHGCSQSVDMSMRLLELNEGCAKKKSGGGKNNLFTRQKQNQLQKENIRNNEECGAFATEKGSAIDMHGDCIERNPVRRLLTIFKSLHENINAEFPCCQLNSVPSDYVYDLPKKSSMPPGCNIRHHVHVLCTKLERFLARLRRTLESNRNLDYNRYTECDGLLNKVNKGLVDLKTFTSLELRQRAMQFISKIALDNAGRLEITLIELRESIKAAQIFVHVFNWEMDLEYRYSSAMTASLEESNKRALEIASADFGALETFSFVEQFLIEHYQIANVVNCAKEHTEFLAALVQSPESYFSPDIIAICEPPTAGRNLQPDQNMCVGALMDIVPMNLVEEVPPLSPPRVNRRSHVPRINRA